MAGYLYNPILGAVFLCLMKGLRGMNVFFLTGPEYKSVVEGQRVKDIAMLTPYP